MLSVAMFITIRLFVPTVGTNGKCLVTMAPGISKAMCIQGKLLAKILEENDGKVPAQKLSLSESVAQYAEKKKALPEKTSTRVDS